MSEVLIDRQGAIALLTLNRPEQMNAYNIALHSALIDAIDDVDNDPKIRAIVVTGAGKAFCAGADLSGGFEALSNNDHIMHGIPRDFGGMLNLRIFECDTPVIAAVNGHAIGIGCTMLLPMDIKIVSSKSKFAMPFTRRGIAIDGAASWFLPRIVGWTQAQRWMVTGETFKADVALSTGMISEVVEPEDVLNRAMEIAHDLAVNAAPESVAMNKRLLRASMQNQFDHKSGPLGAHLMESGYLDSRFKSDDCREGVTAFFEKRAPKFKDFEG